MWSNLRSVLDDLWIKDVNSIPEWTEEDILQMKELESQYLKVNA